MAPLRVGHGCVQHLRDALQLHRLPHLRRLDDRKDQRDHHLPEPHEPVLLSGYSIPRPQAHSLIPKRFKSIVYSRLSSILLSFHCCLI